MSNQWKMCAGCKVGHSDQTKWQECSSCQSQYCEKMSSEIFKWDEKEQCGRCTLLFSQVLVKNANVLAWLATTLGTTVGNIKEKYKQVMVKIGHIIDDSVCARCGRKCGRLSGWADDEEDMGVYKDMGICCMCCGRGTGVDCYCRDYEPTKKVDKKSESITLEAE